MSMLDVDATQQVAQGDGSPTMRAMAATPDLDRAVALLRDAQRVTVLTGAGISTDSGIPDFRGPDGVWTRDPEAEKLATIDHYLADATTRARAWERRLSSGILDRAPNAGHDALVTLERTGRLRCLITQNVDGLHRRAGTDPDLLVEIHGNVREVHCVRCHERGPIEPTVERVRSGEADPPCLACGGVLKPAVVFFGEGLDPTDLDRAFAAAAECDLFLAVGTTLTVSPINGTVREAHRAGAAIVIVNLEATAADHLADVVVRDSISEALPSLVAGLAE